MKPTKPTYKPLFVLLGMIASVAALGVFLTYFNEWSSRRKHSHEIEQAFNERLLPAAAFVRGIVEREHRFPSDGELGISGWHVSSMDDGIQLYRERPQWLDICGVAGKDFIVGTQVPDWNLYYRSWDNQRIEANWP